MKRQALGKGLDALLPPQVSVSALLEVDLLQIRPNALQPRVRFDDRKLDELAASIAENGVLQPIVVRRSGDGGYEIAAGERRWRAAQKAGLKRIPALLLDVSDQKMLELALVENIQRDELSPIEEAHAYQLLVEQFLLTQEEVARRVGRSRAAVANTLRLLKLPREVQQLVQNGELSMGHARALIPLTRKDQAALARRTVARGWPVRAVERRVQRLLNPSPPAASRRDPNLRAAETRLEERLKTRVEIRKRGRRGQIVLHFHSEEELDRLYEELLEAAS